MVGTLVFHWMELLKPSKVLTSLPILEIGQGQAQGQPYPALDRLPLTSHLADIHAMNAIGEGIVPVDRGPKKFKLMRTGIGDKEVLVMQTSGSTLGLECTLPLTNLRQRVTLFHLVTHQGSAQDLELQLAA